MSVFLNIIIGDTVETRQVWTIRKIISYDVYGCFHLLHVWLDAEKDWENSCTLIS